MRRAVQMRLKLDSLLAQLAERVQAEDLKSSAVAQYRVLPGHEPMQPPELIDRRVAGPQIQMIGVAQDDRRPSFFEHLLRQRLDCPLRADGHEGRSIKRAVSGSDSAGSRSRGVVARGLLELEWGVHFSSDLARADYVPQAGSNDCVFHQNNCRAPHDELRCVAARRRIGAEQAGTLVLDHKLKLRTL